MYDDNSTLVIGIVNNGIVITEMLIDPSGKLASNFTYTAVDGLFNVPMLKV